MALCEHVETGICEHCNPTWGSWQLPFKNLTHGIINNLGLYGRKPHKCPICDGNGKKRTEFEILGCNACEGKGIIWG